MKLAYHPLKHISRFATTSRIRCYSKKSKMPDANTPNARPDFATVQASRPAFPGSTPFRFVQTPNPSWKFGQGANSLSDSDPGRDAAHISIDPFGDGRTASQNYKLLISAITPRPIALVSTRSKDGSSTNMASFSFFSMINHDPPLFTIGFIGTKEPKDSLRNLMETEECVINIISETFIEAANASSIDAPYGLSEWDVGGLTPMPCDVVKAPRIKESKFSIEAKLEFLKEWDSRARPGATKGTLAVLAGVRIWAREDAINKEHTLMDPAVLRPVARMGGITYMRSSEAFELERPSFEKDLGGKEGYEKLKKVQKE